MPATAIPVADWVTVVDSALRDCNSPFAKAIRVEDKRAPHNPQLSGVEWGNAVGVTGAPADPSHLVVSDRFETPSKYVPRPGGGMVGAYTST